MHGSRAPGSQLTCSWPGTGLQSRRSACGVDQIRCWEPAPISRPVGSIPNLVQACTPRLGCCPCALPFNQRSRMAVLLGGCFLPSFAPANAHAHWACTELGRYCDKPDVALPPADCVHLSDDLLQWKRCDPRDPRVCTKLFHAGRDAMDFFASGPPGPIQVSPMVACPLVAADEPNSALSRRCPSARCLASVLATPVQQGKANVPAHSLWEGVTSLSSSSSSLRQLE